MFPTCAKTLVATSALGAEEWRLTALRQKIISYRTHGIGDGVPSPVKSVLGIDHRTFKRRLHEPVFYQAWKKG
jgi:hypothetical protein